MIRLSRVIFIEKTRTRFFIHRWDFLQSKSLFIRSANHPKMKMLNPCQACCYKPNSAWTLSYSQVKVEEKIKERGIEVNIKASANNAAKPHYSPESATRTANCLNVDKTIQIPLKNISIHLPDDVSDKFKTSPAKLSRLGLSIKIPKEPTSEEIPSSITRFFLGRYTKYLENFQKALANEMPDTFRTLNTFTSGFKEFVVDFRDYIKISIKLSLPFYDLEELKHSELELYFNMPRQMIQVLPVVVLSSFPLAQNVVLPVAYCFPRHLLCYHFWDASQRQEFSLIHLRKRLYNARPVFRSLQERVDEIKDSVLKERCQTIFFSLGSGVHPSLQEIIGIQQLFADEPFHLNVLYSSHVNGLLRLHNRSIFIRRRRRLREHARYIQCMDKALLKEGVNSNNLEQLRRMMILRGANPTGMTNLEIIEYLENWITVSQQINPSSYSLLLHLPIFLAYNHPTNLSLIYK